MKAMASNAVGRRHAQRRRVLRVEDGQAGTVEEPGHGRSRQEDLARRHHAEKSVPACAGCHGPTGAGIPSQYARLGGQHAEYVSAELMLFRSGKRANSAADDAVIAARLSDAEIAAVSDYAEGLNAGEVRLRAGGPSPTPGRRAPARRPVRMNRCQPRAHSRARAGGAAAMICRCRSSAATPPEPSTACIAATRAGPSSCPTTTPTCAPSSALAAPVPASEGFASLDADFIRVIEDVIDTLISKNVINITDLPGRGADQAVRPQGLSRAGQQGCAEAVRGRRRALRRGVVGRDGSSDFAQDDDVVAPASTASSTLAQAG